MIYCLDTRLVTAFLKGRSRPLVDRLLRELTHATVTLSALTLFELQHGAAVSRRRAANEARLLTFLSAPIEVLRFDEEDARQAGDIGAALDQAGTRIAPYDLLVAAQARRRDAVLATAAGADWCPIPGLRIEDWTVPAQ